MDHLYARMRGLRLGNDLARAIGRFVIDQEQLPLDIQQEAALALDQQ